MFLISTLLNAKYVYKDAFPAHLSLPPVKTVAYGKQSQTGAHYDDYDFGGGASGWSYGIGGDEDNEGDFPEADDDEESESSESSEVT